ncbi:ATP-NAD kinase-like domain-containing protein [Phlebopus sp. FC_14]|nr:ATP-NAD kinase-like domain-containing protein [Phlebopus sp. FC_14]
MSTNELTIIQDNGKTCSLSFSDSSFAFARHIDTRTRQSSCCSHIWRSSSSLAPSQVPIRNVVVASLSDGVVEVSYLDRKAENTRLVMTHISGRVGDKDSIRAKEWCEAIMSLAYKSGNPPKNVKVIINPHGGRGNARSIFTKKVEPILRAAGCTLDVTYTTRPNHALDMAQNLGLDFDALVVVSGDGLIHEVMNGFSKHAQPEKAFSIPIAPVPAGSGNGLSLNLLGLRDGLDPCAAALNVLKGRPMKVDLFSFTQGNQKRISFMSQTIGLMADIDIETEHLRWMGDIRFVYGYLRGVITRRTCKMELSMKVVEQDKSRMVDALHARRASASKGIPVSLPSFEPSGDDKLPENTVSSDGDWIKFDRPLLWMYAGKGPFVSRSLMQFPVSHPDDGLIDISIQEPVRVLLRSVGRKFLISAMDGAEGGRAYWFNSNFYVKASAYRAKPLSGHGGVLMVDGEAFPLEEFRVGVLQRMGTLLSPHPHYAPNFTVMDAKGTIMEEP